MEQTLRDIASKIASRGKGILAADESVPTIGSRFDPLGIPNDESTRNSYRELLLTAPNLPQTISGVILHEETLSQATADGVPFAKLLEAKDVFIGVKVDLGTRQLPNAPAGHKYSVGFEQLLERAQAFREKGARFCKWRSVLKLERGELLPFALEQVANEQALYAAVAQQAGLVPIVEPELLTDGAHSRQECLAASKLVLSLVFKKLVDYRVDLAGILLKPAMVLAGIKHPSRKEESLETRMKLDAAATLECLRYTVPSVVPGVMFLSGGQSEEEATLHLNEINRLGSLPWAVSFSFGRALQASTLKTWAGKTSNKDAALKVFGKRMVRNGQASEGKVEIDWSKATEGDSLFVGNYSY